MKKRLLSVSLVVLLIATMLPIYVASAATATATAGQKNTRYLKTDDTITIMPAEVNGRLIENSKNYYLSVDGYFGRETGLDPNNGPDLRIRREDANIKWRIRNCSNGIFNIQWTNFREHSSDKNWDLDGRKTNEGTIVHLWEPKSKETQKFYLEEDGDGDPETFYIVSNASGRYVAPELKDKEKAPNWNGNEDRLLKLNNKPYRWRIQVLNREADGIESAWMQYIPDDTLLSEVSIPGAHDAGTANVEGSQNEFFNFVATQKYFIDEQLQAGVRAFDLRVCWNDDSQDAVLVHGKNWVVCHHKDHQDSENNLKGNIKFRDALKWIDTYLKDNPSETAILLISINGASGNAETKTKDKVREALNDYNGSLFRWPGGTANDKITMGQVRGKMVALAGSFATDKMSADQKKYFGPTIKNWDMKGGDGLTDIMFTSKRDDLTLSIQDNFSTTGSNKLKSFKKTAQAWKQRIESGSSHGFLFNYASGTKDTPFKCANYVNTDLLRSKDYYLGSDNFDLGRNYTTPMGIVMLDYVDATLCRRVYTNNTIGLFSSSGGRSVLSGVDLDGVTDNDTPEDTSNDTPANTLVKAPANAPAQKKDPQITWPKSATLVYGYHLEEAVLQFDAPNLNAHSFDGIFTFAENADDTPEVNRGAAHTYTLKFIPNDQEKYNEIEKQNFPVTVTKRPIRAVVGTYEIEYGGEVGTWEDVVSLVGRIANDDDMKQAWEAVSMTVTDATGTKQTLNAANGNTLPQVISDTKMPVGTSKPIELQFKDGNGAAFQLPNYEITYEPGCWEIVPRTLELAWSGTETRAYDGKPSNVTAQIKSGLLPDHNQVTVAVQGGTESSFGLHTATAVLSGKDAGLYSIQESADYVIGDDSGKPGVTVQGSHASRTGSGQYDAAATVTIDAGSRSGYRFSGWTVNKGSVVLENQSSATTTFEMPSENVIITANWTRKSSSGSRPSTGSTTQTPSTPPTTPTTPPSTSQGPALDTSTVAIPSGGSYEFLVKGNHDTGNIKIEVANPQIAEVVLANANDSRGAKYRVVMKAQGSTEIRVTYQGQTSTMTINTAPNKGSLTLDTSTYTLAPGNEYTIGTLVRGADGNLLSTQQINDLLAQEKLKVRDSRTGSVVDLKPLPNGNFQIVGKYEGVTYIIYEIGGIHVSVRVEVKNGVQQYGTASRTASYFTK